MLIQALLIVHVAVLGYWLGSELVINSTFRFVSRADRMPYAERDRLLDHTLDVDQHVRYALVLQAGLGTMLGALLGYFPGGAALAVGAGIAMAAWLALVEVTHRLRKAPAGPALARADRALRYALAVLGAAGLAGIVRLPAWLAIKLALFAAVILCGVGIRLALVRYFRIWRQIGAAGSDPEREQALRQGYRDATGVLVLLWVFILAIVVLSWLKP